MVINKVYIATAHALLLTRLQPPINSYYIIHHSDLLSLHFINCNELSVV